MRRTRLVVAALCGLIVPACGSDPGPFRPRQGDGAVVARDSGSTTDRDGGSLDAGSTPLDGSSMLLDSGTVTTDATTATEAGASSLVGMVTSNICGAVSITGDIVVPAGVTVRVCAGSVLSVADAARIEVRGTLIVDGTASSIVTVQPSGTRLGGFVILGSLTGTFLTVQGATLAIDGQAASTISLDGLTITGSTETLSLAHGAVLSHATITGGSTIRINGGVLAMQDSVVDLMHPAATPDCTHWGAGGAQLSHVRITGCHCPIHIQHTTEPVVIEDSIFDGAANPVMIANSSASFHRNHFLGTSTLMLDIGEGIDADVGGNYWGGGMPNIGTRDMSQFRNTTMYSMTAIPGVGPR